MITSKDDIITSRDDGHETARAPHIETLILLLLSWTVYGNFMMFIFFLYASLECRNIE